MHKHRGINGLRTGTSLCMFGIHAAVFPECRSVPSPCAVPKLHYVFARAFGIARALLRLRGMPRCGWLAAAQYQST